MSTERQQSANWVAQLCARGYREASGWPLASNVYREVRASLWPPKNRMREFCTSGSVGGAAGNRCPYPARELANRRAFRVSHAYCSSFSSDGAHAAPTKRVMRNRQTTTTWDWQSFQFSCLPPGAKVRGEAMSLISCVNFTPCSSWSERWSCECPTTCIAAPCA